MASIARADFEQTPAVVVLPMPETAPTGIGVVRALGTAGVPVIAVSCEERPLSYRSRYVSARWPCPDPTADSPGFVRALLELAGELGQRLPLFVTTDAQLTLVNSCRDPLEEAYAYPYLDADALASCVDKSATVGLCEASRIGMPKTLYACDDASRRRAWSEAVYPAVVKPARWAEWRDGRLVVYEQLRSRLGAKATRVGDRRELKAVLGVAAELRVPVVVQEEIPGASDRIFVTATYSDGEGVPLATFTGRKTRQLPSDLGTGTMLESAVYDELARRSRRLLLQGGIPGQADIEYKLDPRDGEYKLMEINPRPATWNSIAPASGVNIPYVAYLHLTGEPVPKAEQSTQRVKWIDGWPDLKYLLRYRRGDHTGRPLTVQQYLRSVRGRREYAYWSPVDPLPGLWRLRQILSRQMSKVTRKLFRRVERPANATEELSPPQVG